MEITCSNLTYKYPGRGKPVFEKLSLSIKPGVTIFKGYSGCGKSTLLRLLSGLLKPSCGAISMPACHTIGSQAFLREDVSIVFQELNLLPLASVKRNIEISCQIGRISSDLGWDWLDRLGMSEHMNQRVDRLSGGQKQRVALARAMSKSPRLLVLDEPSSGLDDDNTAIIKSAVSQFSQNKDVVCVIATHDQRLDSIADDLVDFHNFLSLAQ